MRTKRPRATNPMCAMRLSAISCHYMIVITLWLFKIAMDNYFFRVTPTKYIYILTFYLAFFLWHKYSDIPSGIKFGILFGIYSEILCDIIFCIYILTFYLAFYLTYVLTFYLAFFVAFYLTSVWKGGHVSDCWGICPTWFGTGIFVDCMGVLRSDWPWIPKGAGLLARERQITANDYDYENW